MFVGEKASKAIAIKNQHDITSVAKSSSDGGF